MKNFIDYISEAMKVQPSTMKNGQCYIIIGTRKLDNPIAPQIRVLQRQDFKCDDLKFRTQNATIMPMNKFVEEAKERLLDIEGKNVIVQVKNVQDIEKAIDMAQYAGYDNNVHLVYVPEGEYPEGMARKVYNKYTDLGGHIFILNQEHQIITIGVNGRPVQGKIHEDVLEEAEKPTAKKPAFMELVKPGAVNDYKAGTLYAYWYAEDKYFGSTLYVYPGVKSLKCASGELKTTNTRAPNKSAYIEPQNKIKTTKSGKDQLLTMPDGSVYKALTKVSNVVWMSNAPDNYEKNRAYTKSCYTLD